MKQRKENTDRELLERLDERMEKFSEKVQRLEVMVAVIMAVLVLTLGKSIPLISDAIAKVIQ